MIIKEKTPSYGVANREGATEHERQVCFVFVFWEKCTKPPFGVHLKHGISLRFWV